MALAAAVGLLAVAAPALAAPGTAAPLPDLPRHVDPMVGTFAPGFTVLGRGDDVRHDAGVARHWRPLAYSGYTGPVNSQGRYAVLN